MKRESAYAAEGFSPKMSAAIVYLCGCTRSTDAASAAVYGEVCELVSIWITYHAICGCVVLGDFQVDD